MAFFSDRPLVRALPPDLEVAEEVKNVALEEKGLADLIPDRPLVRDQDQGPVLDPGLGQGKIIRKGNNN